MKLLRSLWGRLINNRFFSFFRKKKLSPTEQSLKKVEQKLLDLHQVSNPDPVKIEELIEQKSTLEVSKELEERKLSPVFDKIQLEEDVQKLNYRNFELEKQSRVLASTPISPWDEPPINLQNIDSLIDTLGSSVDLSGLIPPIISEEDLEASFQDFGLVKTFEEREAIRVRDERELEQQISVYFDLIDRFIQEEKVDEARGHLSDLQNRINSTTDLLKQKKWRFKLKSIIEELESLDVRLLLRRQEEELRRKEEEERKRKEEQEELIERNRIEKEIEKISKLSPNVLLSFEEQYQLLKRKPNWQEFERILNTNEIKYFYHFTDRSNLKKIKEFGGLYSWDFLKRKKILVPLQGGGELSKTLDKRYGLEDYSRLSFCQNHPMKFVAQKRGDLKQPIVLRVKTDICFHFETQISNINATRNGVEFGPDIKYLEAVKFDYVKKGNHFDLNEDEKKYYQAEVMVKTWVPITFIDNLNDF